MNLCRLAAWSWLDMFDGEIPTFSLSCLTPGSRWADKLEEVASCEYFPSVWVWQNVHSRFIRLQLGFAHRPSLNRQLAAPLSCVNYSKPLMHVDQVGLKRRGFLCLCVTHRYSMTLAGCGRPSECEWADLLKLPLFLEPFKGMRSAFTSGWLSGTDLREQAWQVGPDTGAGSDTRKGTEHLRLDSFFFKFTLCWFSPLGQHGAESPPVVFGCRRYSRCVGYLIYTHCNCSLSTIAHTLSSQDGDFLVQQNLSTQLNLLDFVLKPSILYQSLWKQLEMLFFTGRTVRVRACRSRFRANTLTCLTHSAPEPLAGAQCRSWPV